MRPSKIGSHLSAPPQLLVLNPVCDLLPLGLSWNSETCFSRIRGGNRDICAMIRSQEAVISTLLGILLLLPRSHSCSSHAFWCVLMKVDAIMERA